MRYTITITLSQEDLAALANSGYKPYYTRHAADFWAPPTQQDVAHFVRDAIREELEHKYISSGAVRGEYLYQWKKRKTHKDG